MSCVGCVCTVRIGAKGAQPRGRSRDTEGGRGREARRGRERPSQGKRAQRGSYSEPAPQLFCSRGGEHAAQTHARRVRLIFERARVRVPAAVPRRSLQAGTPRSPGRSCASPRAPPSLFALCRTGRADARNDTHVGADSHAGACARARPPTERARTHISQTSPPPAPRPLAPPANA